MLPTYGTCEGPLGLPCTEDQARALEALLTAHPGHEYERITCKGQPAELSPGERADVSWVMTEAIDRQREVLLLAGFDDNHYRANPVVTFNHDYGREPVGRSAWRRKVREDGTRGIKAKTLYPERPAEWPADKPWAPDAAFALVKSGLMSGKSVGFLTLESSGPTEQEVKANPAWADAWRVVRRWALVEIACTWLPVNPACITEVVSKGLLSADQLREWGVEVPAPAAPREGDSSPTIIPHTTLDQVESAVRRAFAAVDLKGLADRAVAAAIDRARGRV